MTYSSRLEWLADPVEPCAHNLCIGNVYLARVVYGGRAGSTRDLTWTVYVSYHGDANIESPFAGREFATENEAKTYAMAAVLEALRC